MKITGGLIGAGPTQLIGGYSTDPYAALGIPKPGTSAPAPTPAPLAPSPAPWDALEQSQEALLNKNYQNTIAQLGQQETATKSDYGFDPQFASNPLTRANLLQRSYEQSRLGATNRSAAAGQLYSGSLSNALGYADFAHNQNYNNLQTSYQDALNKISQGKIGAQQTLSQGILDAQAKALDTALANPPEPVTPDNSGGGAGAAGGSKAAAKAGTRAKLKRAGRKPKFSSGLGPLPHLIGGSTMKKKK